MGNSSFRSSYISKKNKRFGQLRLDDESFNLNQSTGWVLVPFNVEDKIDKGFEVSGNGLVAQFDDWCEAKASVYMETTVARSNVEICFAVNGTPRPVIGSTGYIRNTNNHNHASSHVEDGFQVEVGDVITLMCRQEANTGTVFSPSGSSILKLASSPVDVVKGPAGTYYESFEYDLGQWTNAGSGDWTRYTGPTPSSGTGTAGSYDGSYFMYCECSSNGYLEDFALSTTYFNKLRKVEFAYQLEGTACGTLKLQYKDKYGLWVTKWSVSGDQGSAYINVSEEFNGIADIDEATAIRFHYSGATDYQGDCCIDGVRITSV